MLNGVLTPVSLASMGATAVMFLLSYLLAVHLGKSFKKSNTEKWVMCWLLWDAMIHFLVEGSFVALSLSGTVMESKHWTSLLWKEYALADSRWGVSDPTIVAIEIITVFGAGPMCLWVVWGICNNSACRHFWQLVLCTCELYGGWMTFVPDILIGSPSLATDNFLYLWIYLVFYNGVWVVVPILLMWQSYNNMTAATSTDAEKEEQNGSIDEDPTQRRYNLRSKNK